MRYTADVVYVRVENGRDKNDSIRVKVAEVVEEIGMECIQHVFEVLQATTTGWCQTYCKKISSELVTLHKDLRTLNKRREIIHTYVCTQVLHKLYTCIYIHTYICTHVCI